MALLQSWLTLISGVVTLLAGLVTALWAYTKFILERGLIPPVQFDINCNDVGVQKGKHVLEVLVHLKNLGTSTLVASHIIADILYLDSSDPLDLINNPSEAAYGRLRFPRAVRKDLQNKDMSQPARSGKDSANSQKRKRGITIVPHDTFVQPGVDQIYTLVTAVPQSTTYVLIRASFEYAQHPSLLARRILFVSRKLGLIQYSLDHVNKPHTIERAYQIP